MPEGIRRSRFGIAIQSIAACNLELATLPSELATFQLRFRYPESAKHPHQVYVAAGEQDKA